ncbi:MAG TPA: FAD-binding oxidoreductase [Alphaproteobacteria bacterium]|nr:FAD-binding oxidoreductase [Alphaproteobacteria bacterium]
MTRECDYLIVGSGIAGASVAYHLAPRGTVIILEREDQPGYHSTGRSAAVFAESYGPRLMRVMTMASGDFLRRPPDGFASTPLMHPRGALFVARADQREFLEELVKELSELSDSIKLVSVDAALALCPVLKKSYVAAAAHDPSVMDMDVNAIHQGYLRGSRAKGATIVTNAEVTAFGRKNGKWLCETRAGAFAAPVVIDAAGAWADVIADLAGVRRIGLQPKRRTVIIFDAPHGTNFAKSPVAADCAEQFYFKPESGRVLASPADETPVEPQDIQPDELDVALVVDRIEKASTLKVGRILRRWAGLRSFVQDKNPVVGFAPDAEGFFWLAGQGGYGIQTSYAMGLTAASLAAGLGLPDAVKGYGIGENDLGPARLWA